MGKLIWQLNTRYHQEIKNYVPRHTKLLQLSCNYFDFVVWREPPRTAQGCNNSPQNHVRSVPFQDAVYCPVYSVDNRWMNVAMVER